MANADRIPLFPLDVVLLPSMSLPLHIFEPRYKLMIRRCSDENVEFGMVLASNRSVANIGCTAALLRITRQYPDGRMDILSEGRRVFRLVEVIDEKDYYEGMVEYLVDEPSEPTQAVQTALLPLFAQCHQLLFGNPWEDPAPAEPAALAYRMAAHLPMELSQRQSLLEMRKEEDRRLFLLEWLTRFLPQLADREHKRHLAGGNGHALN